MENKKNRSHIEIFLILVILLLLIASAIGGSYAWFAGNYTELIVDSGGLKISASLEYLQVDADNDMLSTFIPQGRTTPHIVTERFYAGSTLSYKITVKNNSNQLPTETAEPAPTYPPDTADISVSLSSLDNYFEEAVNLYLNNNNTHEDEINRLINDNAGIILFRLSNVEYKVFDVEGVVKTVPQPTVEEGRFLRIYYSDEEPLCTYEGLEPGEYVEIYVTFECVTPTIAIGAFETYMAGASGVITTETDNDKKAALQYVYEKELDSIVIQKNEVDGVVSASSSRANIDYFTIKAENHEE